MKKTVCLLLALLVMMTAAVLTGCGGVPENTDTTQNGGASGTTPADSGTEKSDGNSDSANGEFKVGNIVTFGSYEQDNDPSNGAEPIKWRVLEVYDGKALLISVCCLDAKQYNSGLESITWENSLLRKWLNDDFHTAAFSEEEQSRIVTTHVENNDNAKFGTAGGNDTEDKVFLLSFAEVNQYFDSKEAKQCVPTAFAIANGAEESSYAKVDGKPTALWWLRSPGSNSIYVAGVRDNGNADEGGFAAINTMIAVRPVIWVTTG